MAGIKQFDMDEVLGRATEVFWARGYEGTSIQALVEATGLHRGSLYGAFGDKEHLFLKVLDYYAQKTASEMRRCLEDEDALRGLERFFETLIQRMTRTDQPCGCLYTNTAVEAPAAPDPISRCIAGHLGEFESSLYNNLRRVQSSGKIKQGADLRALARFLTAVCQGMSVLNRIQGDPSVLRDTARIALGALAHPPV